LKLLEPRSGHAEHLLGLVLIAIGLLWAIRILGVFNYRSIIFDALGVFFIVRGAWTLKQAKAAASAPLPHRPDARVTGTHQHRPRERQKRHVSASLRWESVWRVRPG
jgi:hypothetical protein